LEHNDEKHQVKFFMLLGAQCHDTALTFSPKNLRASKCKINSLLFTY